MNITELDNGNYLYLPDYNVIINRELKDRFIKYGAGRIIRFRPRERRPGALREKVRRDLHQIIFQATQNCNLRCKYCVFSGHYSHHRTAAPKYLSRETAFQAVDYLWKLLGNRRKKEFVFSFFGGEPLLNFPVMEETTAYIRHVFRDWKIRFFVTTNFTLLTDAMLDFLLRENYHLTISLDGPPASHDAKRVFSDGSGSFATVAKNLERLHAANPRFLEENVNLEAVYSQDLSFRDFYEFFSCHPFFSKIPMRYSDVDKYDTDYYHHFPADPERLKKEVEEIRREICSKWKSGTPLTPVDKTLSLSFTRTRQYLKIRDSFETGHTCQFDDKLFIDAEGVFHVCEKINPKFPIGDVRQGLDFRRMEEMLDEFSAVIVGVCRDCVFRHLCFRCFVHLTGDGEFRVGEAFCADRKKYLSEALERLIQYAREGVFQD